MGKTSINFPEHLVLAIKHEYNCILFRDKQIENYKKRIKLMEKGMCYFDTFKKLPSIKGVGFPDKRYKELKKKCKKKKPKK